MAEWQEFDWQSLMQDWRADGMKRGYADTPEGQIHYVIAGEGDALVLIHQMVRSSRMWLKVMPLLAEKYKVVAVDMLGHGFSASPPIEGDTVSILADSVVHTMDELGIPKAHVLGLHTGCRHDGGNRRDLPGTRWGNHAHVVPSARDRSGAPGNPGRRERLLGA